MKTTLLLLTTCVVVPALSAQNDSTNQPHWRKAQVRQQVERMRKAMREGRIVRYNVKVKVRLKNGNKIQGIVRNGRFIEKHDGLDFVVTDKRSEQAGLRLWYYNGTNSYIFLPHADIAHYKLGIKMSDREIAELERKLVAAERRRREMERQLAEERRRRLMAKRKSQKNEKSAADLEQEERQEYGRKLTKDERTLLSLLDDYPPEKGWGEKKIKDLKLRRITIGVYPNKEEKKFEESFEDWKKAVELKKELEQNKPRSGRK
jgi:hypothetical protein